MRYDFIVVGARCAGAAAAMLLARQGARVLVLDSGGHGSDTLSTHFVWPRGVRRLEAWGLLPAVEAAGTPLIRRIAFDPGCAHLVADLELPALCPRRTLLDRLLVEAAAAAGADVRHDTTVEGLVEGGGRVTGVRHRAGRHRAGVERADVVVGADGRRSTVARLAGAGTLESHSPQTGGFYAYFANLPVDGAEFWIGGGRLTYLWATNDGLTLAYVGVRAAGFDRLRHDVRKGLAAGAIDAGELRERISAATMVGGLHGFAGEGPSRRRRSGPGWVLLGDAAAFKDPTAGMGISEAFADAGWLAARAGSASPEPAPDAERERAAATVFDHCLQAARLEDPEPWLAGVYRRAAGEPEVARDTLRMLGGELSGSALVKSLSARVGTC